MGPCLVGGEPGQRHALGEQPGGGEQAGAGAAGGAEDADRAAEGRGEVEDAVDVGAAEGVDRLVRVAEGEHRAPTRRPAAAPGGPGRPARERAQQPDLRRVGVLVLVDEDRVVRGERGRVGGVGEQHGAVDELRVVEDALEVEDVQVLGEEAGGGPPVGASDPPGELLQGARPQAQLAGAGEDGADLVGEAAGGEAGAQFVGPPDPAEARLLQVDLPGEQLADGQVLLGSGEQPQRLGEEFGVLVGADQGVAVRVEGRRLRGPPPAQPGRHPVAELDGRLAAEGEDEDPLGVGAALQPGRDRLHQRRRLPGAGSGEDQQWSVRVVNHRALRCVQHRGPHRCRHGPHQPVRTGAPHGRKGGGGSHVGRRSCWWMVGGQLGVRGVPGVCRPLGVPG